MVYGRNVYHEIKCPCMYGAAQRNGLPAKKIFKRRDFKIGISLIVEYSCIFSRVKKMAHFVLSGMILTLKFIVEFLSEEERIPDTAVGNVSISSRSVGLALGISHITV